MADATPKNVVLIGYRGCGKTTVGRLLARRMDRPFVDTDELIEAEAGMSIAEIFNTVGEPGFRRREAEVIARLTRRGGQVISAGGGAVLDGENVRGFRESGTVVWLTAPPDVLWQRIHADDRSAGSRPDLTARGGLDEVHSLLQHRVPLYQRAANIVIDTANRDPAEVARLVQQAVRKTEQK